MLATQAAVQPVDRPFEIEAQRGSSGSLAPELLESWKDIAGYLRRDVRTVQRWEKSLGLPVHRVQNSKSGSVCAYKNEIDNWRRERMMKVARDRLPAVVEPSRSPEVETVAAPWLRPLLPLAALLFGILLGAGVTVFTQRYVHPIAAVHVPHPANYAGTARKSFH